MYVYVTRHAQSSQKMFTYLCNISRKSMGDEVDFLPANKHESFYKMIVSLWVCVSRHAQSTQNSKFAISLQHLKQNVKDEVGFFQADKRQSFFQIDICVSSIIFTMFWDYLMFYQFLPIKWNDARLLPTNMVYTSCLTSCWTT